MKNSINYLKFPTTALLIDDNSIFLDMIADQLQPNLTYKLYEQPKKALRFILDKKHRQSLELQHLLYKQLDNDCIENVSEIAFRFDVTELQKLVCNKQRHELISMILVDYDMAGMNGIEFCRQLENCPIKKILFTGKADSDLAVKAFNEGIIDRFLLKQSVNFIEEINQAIADMEMAYFSQYTKMILNNIEMIKRPYLSDPVIHNLLQQHLDQHKPVEYYLIDSKGSYLFLDQFNRPSFFLLNDDEDMDNYFQMANDNEANLSILSKLKAKTHIPLMNSLNFEQLSHMFGPIAQWENCLHPTVKVTGEKMYYYSYIVAEDLPELIGNAPHLLLSKE